MDGEPDVLAAATSLRTHLAERSGPPGGCPDLPNTFLDTVLAAAG
nr:hypothetical protein [Rhodococcus sp. MSC1_016]